MARKAHKWEYKVVTVTGDRGTDKIRAKYEALGWAITFLREAY